MSGSSAQISIVDYGVGNLYSLSKAIANFSSHVSIAQKARDIEKSDALILPGVGSFGTGMREIDSRGLRKPIIQFAEAGRPILGICLGAQIMLSKGFEFGEFEGLNLIPGQVTIFPKLPKGIKLPHIGWNSILSSRRTLSWKDTILKSTKPKENVYFVHSYIMQPYNMQYVLSTTSYGGKEFCSAIRYKNIYGCQFHPEKSGKAGLAIIKDFVSLI